MYHVTFWCPSSVNKIRFLFVTQGYSSARMGISLANDVVTMDGKKYAL